MAAPDIQDTLDAISTRLEREFHTERRVLSLEQYLQLLAAEPARFCRDARQYLRDAFEHFGSRPVKRPWGELTSHKLFDLAFLSEDESRRANLIGQEQVQSEIYRVLCNFTREGRANKLIL